MNKLAVAFPAIVGAVVVVVLAKISFWNHTESIPVGLYMKTLSPIEVGSTVSFPAPQKAREYALMRWGNGDAVQFIKALAAGPGDTVCVLATNHGEWLLINDKAVINVHPKDRNGNDLPHWLSNDCRKLDHDEWLPLGHHPDSFDGRYFGPIKQADMEGPYSGVLLFR